VLLADLEKKRSFFREKALLDTVKGVRAATCGAWCSAGARLVSHQRKELIMVPVNRTNTQAHDAQVIAGIEKHLQTVSSLPLLGSTYTPADLAKLVQSRLDAASTTTTTKANWHSTVAAERALNAKLTPVLRALRQYVINVFGEARPVLADFGFAPSKLTTRTPEEKAAAVAKAIATRKARHTMGPKQKKGVKGAVTGIVLTPVSAPQPALATNGPSAPATSTGTPTGGAPHTP
jgi:hypothetical protein